MPDRPPDPVDLSAEYVLPGKEDAYAFHRAMESAAVAAAGGDNAFEKLHARAYELASQTWLNIWYGMRILEGDEVDDRMTAAEALEEARSGWRQYCRDREGVAGLDPTFGIDLLEERVERELLRNYRARLEHMQGNRNPDGRTEYEVYLQSQGQAPSSPATPSPAPPRPPFDDTPLCRNLKEMQRLWRVGEENARKSSLPSAPSPAVLGMARGDHLTAPGPKPSTPSPPTPPVPSGSRRRTT
jgi:hypothetical protein